MLCHAVPPKFKLAIDMLVIDQLRLLLLASPNGGLECFEHSDDPQSPISMGRLPLAVPMDAASAPRTSLQLAWTEPSTGSVVLAIAQVAPTRTPSQGPYRARITLLRIRRRDRVQRSTAQPSVAPALMSQLFWQNVIDADFRFDAESVDDSDSYWQPKLSVLLENEAMSTIGTRLSAERAMAAAADAAKKKSATTRAQKPSTSDAASASAAATTGPIAQVTETGWCRLLLVVGGCAFAIRVHYLTGARSMCRIAAPAEASKHPEFPALAPSGAVWTAGVWSWCGRFVVLGSAAGAVRAIPLAAAEVAREKWIPDDFDCWSAFPADRLRWLTASDQCPTASAVASVALMHGPVESTDIVQTALERCVLLVGHADGSLQAFECANGERFECVSWLPRGDPGARGPLVDFQSPLMLNAKSGAVPTDSALNSREMQSMLAGSRLFGLEVGNTNCVHAFLPIVSQYPSPIVASPSHNRPAFQIDCLLREASPEDAVENSSFRVFWLPLMINRAASAWTFPDLTQQFSLSIPTPSLQGNIFLGAHWDQTHDELLLATDKGVYTLLSNTHSFASVTFSTDEPATTEPIAESADAAATPTVEVAPSNERAPEIALATPAAPTSESQAHAMLEQHRARLQRLAETGRALAQLPDSVRRATPLPARLGALTSRVTAMEHELQELHTVVQSFFADVNHQMASVLTALQSLPAQ